MLRLVSIGILGCSLVMSKAQNVKGTITCNGAGVPGVAVSDGYEVVTTNEDGEYSFTSKKTNGYVFYSLPGGYEPEVKDGFAPKIWEKLSTKIDEIETHDFRLKKVNNDKHRLIVGADTHLAARTCDLVQFGSQFIKRLRQEVKDAGDTPIYSTILGDLAWDNYWYANSYDLASFMNTLTNDKYPLILFPVMGNHDNDGATTPNADTDFNASAPFRNIVCPNYYSYNLGKIHYVVLDDIYYKNEDTGGSYSTGIVGTRNYDNHITQEQLDWLKKDLALVDKDTPVFLGMHIPVWRLNSSFSTYAGLTNHNSINSTVALSEIVKDFKTVHIITGHTHYNYHVYPEAYPNIHENNIAAVCATWWWTGIMTGRHICRDGSPGGYEVFDIDGTDIKWKYHSIEDPSNPQFIVYDLNTVKEFYNTNATMQAILTKYTTRTNYGKYGNNMLLLNVYNYDPNWNIEVTENNKKLPVTRSYIEDPLHTLAYDVPRMAQNNSLTSDFMSNKSLHIFTVQCETATAPVTVKVTDAFGNVYEQQVQRPIPYTINKNIQTNEDALVDIHFDHGGMRNTGSYNTIDLGYRGTATTVMDPVKDATYGVTDNSATSYFFLKYDKNSTLGQAFAHKATWELLFRLDKSTPQGTDGVHKIFSSQQDGGWSLCYNLNKGLGFQYVTSNDGDAAVNTALFVTPHIITGRFYHIAVTVDNDNKTLAIYINGKKAGETKITGNEFRFPNCGTTRRETGMWFCLGADPGGTDNLGSASNSNASTFVFARIYDDIKGDDEVAALYNDDVKYYTEAQKPSTEDMLIDAVFNANGAIDASAYGDSISHIDPMGKPVLQYNAEQKRYEGVFSGYDTGKSSQNYSRTFFMRPLYYEPSITSQMSDAFSIEVYAKPNSDNPAVNTSPMSIQQSGGVGIEFRATGIIAWNCNTYGYINSNSGLVADRAALKTAANSFNTQYNHYVFVYDRLGGLSKIYINGQQKNSAAINEKDYLDFPFALYQWMVIGGDARANVGTICDFPWNGNISIARLWGKALTQEDISLLYSQAKTPKASITTDAKGYATACMPFAMAMPSGLTAYVATDQSYDKVSLAQLASTDEVVAYGIPVLLQGEPNTTYTLEAADLETATLLTPTVNLLEGTLATKPVKDDEMYLLGSTDNGESVLNLSAATTMQANLAYLPSDNSGSKIKMIYNIDAIKAAANVQRHKSNAYYDLQGRIVAKPKKGIYILNGRKVYVK